MFTTLTRLPYSRCIGASARMPRFASTLVVQTKSGPVRGQTKTTIDGLEYASFQGIPFARPPLGALRFKAPQPVAAWTEPLDALAQPPSAAASTYDNKQMEPLTSEDCLYLNIFTRNLPCTKPSHPVMIFIHGGGFMRGSTSEAKRGPDFLLRKDVILVTIAYRLGALGFLSVAEPKFESPGNAGLKDQTMAIRWIVDNIASFGGDPKNITLFGESAGASAVHLHILSEHSKGLFQKAILQSGTGFCEWAKQPQKDINGMLARRLGWNGEGGVDAMMDVLLEADVADIVIHQWVEDTQDKQSGKFFVYCPCVEPYQDKDSFVPAAPESMARSAWGNQLPLIIGCNSDEGFIFYYEWKRNQSMFDDDGYFVNAIPSDVLPTLTEEQRHQKVNAIKQLYHNGSASALENLRSFVRLTGDRLFWHPTIAAIRERHAMDGGCAPTFVYRFDFDSNEPMFGAVKMGQCGEIVKGTIHAEDLMYIFRQAHIDYGALPEGSPELRVVDTFSNLWTSFAANGNPNCDGTGWEPLRGTSATEPVRCLSITDSVKMVDLPESEGIAFWDSMHKG